MKVGVVIIKVAILSTGEEIIEGDILNTTSREISRELYNMGFEISSHINVGDKRYDIITYLNILSRNNDIIFITGGLGSTRDDLTRESVAEFLKEDLIFDEHLFNKIIYRYKKYGKSSSELLKKQAFVFKDSIILENEIGSAPGIYIIRDMKHYFLLPGPPDEAISIFLKHIKPILSNFDTQKIKVKKIQFYNITESKLMAELNERLSNIKYSTKLELSIGPSIIFKDDDEKIEPVIKYINEKFEKYIIPNDPIKKLVKVLNRDKKTISTAESCTGGMIGNLITNIPGSSSVYKGGIIAYSIFSKEKIFNIDASFLKEYGAVNSKTVEIMAREALKIFDSDYAISVSGIAGPDTDEFNTPVGTVFFGIYSKNCDKIIVERKKFSGTREIVKRKASYYILIKLLKKLL